MTRMGSLVPEPSIVAMIAAGLVLLLGLNARRKRKR